MSYRSFCSLALVACVVVLAAPAIARERIVTNVYFDWGSTTLDAKASDAVKAAAPKAKACEYNGLRVVGHADTSHTGVLCTGLRIMIL